MQRLYYYGEGIDDHRTKQEVLKSGVKEKDLLEYYGGDIPCNRCKSCMHDVYTNSSTELIGYACNMCYNFESLTD